MFADSDSEQLQRRAWKSSARCAFVLGHLHLVLAGSRDVYVALAGFRDVCVALAGLRDVQVALDGCRDVRVALA